MRSNLINAAARHGGDVVLAINRHVHQPWDTWKNLHRPPAARLYGLGDEYSDFGDENAISREGAYVPTLYVGEPLGPPSYIPEFNGVNTSPGTWTGTSTISSPPITGGSSAVGGFFSSLLDFARAKSGLVTVNPRPGSLVNSQTASFLGSQSTTNLMMVGAGLAALFLIMKKK